MTKTAKKKTKTKREKENEKERNRKEKREIENLLGEFTFSCIDIGGHVHVIHVV